MASDNSFDIVSKVDISELKNAINQVIMEIKQRYDFKGTKSSITIDDKGSAVTLISEDETRLKSVIDVFHSKCIKRKVPIKNFSYGNLGNASGGMVRQVVDIQQGIPTEKGKEIVKIIKGTKLKVQSSIQNEQLRVSSKKKDELQTIIALLKDKDFGINLQFVNFR